jgi:hypothetical protein
MVGGTAGDLPVAGDWSGKGTAKVGLFRPSTGEWFLDLDGNGQSYNCNLDKCLTFGAAGDIPVVGDWTGTGIANIGVYRPGTGEWFQIPTAMANGTVVASMLVFSFSAKTSKRATYPWSELGAKVKP